MDLLSLLKIPGTPLSPNAAVVHAEIRGEKREPD